jgi:hypothetical protein
VYKRQGVTLFFERIQADADRSIFRQSGLKQLRLFTQKRTDGLDKISGQFHLSTL